MNHHEKYRHIISSRIRSALRELGIARRGQGVWVSERMEVTTKAANKWINGETAPRPSKWERLAEVLSKHKNYFEHLENDDYLETGEESLSYDMDREFLSVVIKLPDDDDARKTIIQTLGFGNRLHGAEITAVSAGDVIS